jgi:subtilisin family serine protease
MAADGRKRIVVIDTGLNVDNNFKPFLCKDWEQDMTGFGIQDDHGHGTNVAGIIIKGLDSKKVCLVIVKYYTALTPNSYNFSYFLNAIRLVPTLKPSVVNLSSNGGRFVQTELDLLRWSILNGVYFNAAAGNDHIDLDKGCFSFPACYNVKSKYVNIVGSHTNGKYDVFTNFGKVVTTYQPGKEICYLNNCMSGTSQATAVFTNKLVKYLTSK